MEPITIRDARKEDASDIARLFMMAWPVEEFLAMDPSLTEEGLCSRIRRYVEAGDTLYSYVSTVVGTVMHDGAEKVVGALHGYE